MQEAQVIESTTDMQNRVDTYIANRTYIIEKIKPLLIEGTDVYTLPGMTKQSLGKPGAEKLAAFFGLTGKFEVDKDTMEVIGAQANGKQYIAYVCNLSRSGRIAGQGRGATFIEWMRNSYQMVFTKPVGTPEKDGWKGPFNGKSKKPPYKDYTFWKVPEPAVFDSLALNKAIKMAQKSAFVDAVIRTTGMSDLFTQDLEDMREVIEAEVVTEPANAPATDEPFAGQTSYEKDEEVHNHSLKQENKPVNVGGEEIPSCDLCGRLMKKRKSAKGEFWGCSGYPKCQNIKNL